MTDAQTTVLVKVTLTYDDEHVSEFGAQNALLTNIPVRVGGQVNGPFDVAVLDARIVAGLVDDRDVPV